MAGIQPESWDWWTFFIHMCNPFIHFCTLNKNYYFNTFFFSDGWSQCNSSNEKLVLFRVLVHDISTTVVSTTITPNSERPSTSRWMRRSICLTDRSMWHPFLALHHPLWGKWPIIGIVQNRPREGGDEIGDDCPPMLAASAITSWWILTINLRNQTIDIDGNTYDEAGSKGCLQWESPQDWLR